MNKSLRYCSCRSTMFFVLSRSRIFLDLWVMGLISEDTRSACCWLTLTAGQMGYVRSQDKVRSSALAWLVFHFTFKCFTYNPPPTLSYRSSICLSFALFLTLTRNVWYRKTSKGAQTGLRISHTAREGGGLWEITVPIEKKERRWTGGEQVYPFQGRRRSRTSVLSD